MSTDVISPLRRRMIEALAAADVASLRVRSELARAHVGGGRSNTTRNSPVTCGVSFIRIEWMDRGNTLTPLTINMSADRPRIRNRKLVRPQRHGLHRSIFRPNMAVTVELHSTDTVPRPEFRPPLITGYLT
jgi:hypothetical protein